VFTQNARFSVEGMTEAPTTNKSHRFDLEIGQESINLPPGVKKDEIVRVCLVTMRNRNITLVRTDEKTFAEFGRKFLIDEGQAPTYLRGMPLYYLIHQKRLLFWPVPAHRWDGFIETRDAMPYQDDLK